MSLADLRKALGFGKGWSDEALDNGLPTILKGSRLMVAIEDAAFYLARTGDLEQPLLPPSQEADVVDQIKAVMQQRLRDYWTRND